MTHYFEPGETKVVALKEGPVLHVDLVCELCGMGTGITVDLQTLEIITAPAVDLPCDKVRACPPPIQKSD